MAFQSVTPVAARRLWTDWIAACSWYGPIVPRASARAMAVSPTTNVTVDSGSSATAGSRSRVSLVRRGHRGDPV